MRNPVPIKADGELWDIVKGWCDKRGIKYQHFTDRALEDRLRKLNQLLPNKLK